MAFRPLLRQRAIPAVAAVVTGASVVAFAPRTLYAEERLDPSLNRKPIYDDTPLGITHPSQPSPSQPSAPTAPSTPNSSYRPTPTDRLAVQIGQARMALYKQATRAEDGINNALTETLRLEHSFTSTIRSLAPPKQSGERIFPGALYVLVASMAGSIITRNRNILLRATVPAAIGIGAAYAVLPITTRNVGDLIWTYEERYPVLAEAHMQTKARVQRFFETGKAHSQMGVAMMQDKVGETREKVDEWLKKGR